jgi:hypothetical protein
VGIYDRIADPKDIQAIIEIEHLTNDRIRGEAGQIALVPAADRISGPGTTPIMAAFTHAQPSRFSDGTYGVYYAARELDTAVAETVYHVERLYRSTSEVSADVDMLAYVAQVDGSFEDLRGTATSDPRLDPGSYGASQSYARALHDGNTVDGIVYPSVRDSAHRDCVGCFRPRVISLCRPHCYVTYRWNGLDQRITGVLQRELFTGT